MSKCPIGTITLYYFLIIDLFYNLFLLTTSAKVYVSFRYVLQCRPLENEETTKVC